MVPTVAPSEALRPPISDDLISLIKLGVLNYHEIIDSGDTDWLSNIDRLKNIFHWGVALGKLIHVVDENPKEAETASKECRLIHDQLQKLYEAKKALINVENLKKGYEIVLEGSDEVMKQLLFLHLNLDPDTEKDLQMTYSKFDIRTDLKVEKLFLFSTISMFPKVPEMFPVSELKKETVVATAVFYLYQLPVLMMFRRGLQEGIAKSDPQKVDFVLNKELLRLYVDLDSTFKKLEERMNKI